MLHHEVAARELSLEVISGGPGKYADQWLPLGSVRANGPQTPQALVAQSLSLVAGKHDASILQGRGMQGAAQVQVTDQFNVLAVLVHDEELQVGEGVAFVRQVTVATGTEHHLPTGQRTGAEVEDAVSQIHLVAVGRVLRPISDPGVGRPFLMGQPDDLTALQVDLVNVRPGP